ncbi:MAG: succinate dehydrogenase, hydrophobic membrane anchor protein [Parvularculaceae bacterium]
MAHKHKGTATFIIQRFTAVLLIPLVLWFLIGAVSHLGAGYDAARAWAGQWQNGLLLGLFAVIGAVHMRIGMAEIIADYIQSGVKSVLHFFNWLVAAAVIGAAAWAVYTLSFAG